MTCDELIHYLSDYIDNNLDSELSAAAQEHLATCENCRVVLNSTQKMILLYREHEQAQVIPAERQQRLYDSLLDIFLQPSQEQD